MRKISLGLAAALVAVGLAQSAAADSWTYRDRSGGRGPLAIASIKAGHVSGTAPTITITFDRRLKPGTMGRRDFVVVDIEGDGRRPSDSWVYLVADRGRLVSFDYNPRTREVFSGPTIERPSPRSVRLQPRTNTDGGMAIAAASYSENAAAGCGGGCWDAVPQRGYLVHDWTAPDVERFVAPEGWWYEERIPVSWKATDTGFSGLAWTSVVWREAGTGRWRPLVTRSSPGRHEATVPAVEGAHMMMEAVAQDRARNTGRLYGFTLTRVPFDDASGQGTGTFGGVWLEQEDATAYRGSFQVATAPASTMSFREKANEYCVVVQWLEAEPAHARFQVGDGAPADIRHGAGDGAYRHPYCIRVDEIEEQTATFTVLAGRAGVDGYWAGVDGQWTLDGDLAYRASVRPHTPVSPSRRPSLRDLQKALPVL